MQKISTQKAPAAIGPYSQAIKTGNLVFCSGQIALTPAGDFHDESVENQTEQILENLKSVLETADSSLQRVVKTTIFLTNIADFAAVNAVYEKAFRDHKPARSTIAVAALPKGAKVEIEAIAEV